MAEANFGGYCLGWPKILASFSGNPSNVQASVAWIRQEAQCLRSREPLNFFSPLVIAIYRLAVLAFGTKSLEERGPRSEASDGTTG